MASEDGVFQCFVSGLNCDTDVKDLEKTFSEFGTVVDSKIIYDHETGRSKKFGFVTFEEEKSMIEAITEMNGRGQKKIGFQCFVHGLGCDTDSKSLASEFSIFGEVLDSEIIHDRETGISKGFGFVTYKEEKSMRDAIILMDGDEIDGCYIKVEEARQKNGAFPYITVKEARPRKPSRAELGARLFVKLIKENGM